MTKTIVISILTVLMLTGAAMAQNTTAFGETFVFDGFETSKGTPDKESYVQYGNTFVLKSMDEFGSRYLTVSINHYTGKGTVVKGGAWSLAVLDEKGYAGTIYGDVVSGEILDLTDDTGKVIVKQTLINLIVTGGTGNFAGVEFEKIAGSMQLMTALSTLETKGSIELKF